MGQPGQSAYREVVSQKTHRVARRVDGFEGDGQIQALERATTRTMYREVEEEVGRSFRPSALGLTLTSSKV